LLLTAAAKAGEIYVVLSGTTEVVPFPFVPQYTKSKSKAADRSVRST